MKILGVDPGRHGAAALYTGGSGLRRSIQIIDLPYDDEGRIIYRRYRDLLLQWKPDVAYVENVWPRNVKAPKNKGEGMGFITSNKFMKGCGALEGITACYVDDSHLVVPSAWKRMFGLIKYDEETGPQVKTRARHTLVDLFFETAPIVRRVGDDGRAEAALIAIYGAVRQGIVNLGTTA